MKAYIVESNRVIEPFGDHPRDCLIANHRLGDIQREALYACGMDVEYIRDIAQISDPSEYVVLNDSLFFTKELMQRFIVESRILGSPTTCALKRGLITRYTMVQTQDVDIRDDSVEYGLQYMPVPKQRGETFSIVIDPEQFSEPVPLPEHMHSGFDLRIPLSDVLLIQVDHWANLWSANIGTLLAEAAGLRKAPKTKLLWLALKARSLNKWKVFQRTTNIGNNCDIHPTAYIEGSRIDDNVKIGAGSVIRLSHIGEGTSIGSNATIECSVVGERCALDSMSGAFASVLYPGTATSAKLIYISICGRNTFLADGVYLADFRFDKKNITVLKDGVPVDTGNVGLGVCLGHDVYLGAGCVVEPGRAIENGLRIVPEGIRTISRLYADGSIPGHKIINPDDM